ncbi:MAG: hypothetical protein ABW023_09440 [Sphingomonas sp.]
MTAHNMLTEIDGPLLADAFPAALRPEAVVACAAMARHLNSRQWTERFSVQVEGEQVLIPARLHFVSDDDPSMDHAAWLIRRSLRTRSGNGFERQRAVRDLLSDLQPWSAPFVMALIGEYVVEILIEIDTAMTGAGGDTLASFIVANPVFWQTTKQRVASYWNVYYCHHKRSEYVGFELIDKLEAIIPKLPVKECVAL